MQSPGQRPQAQLGLGTVQLGLPYGNLAKAPLMPESKAFEILHLAVASGISFFDTAIAYGESEARLGRYGLAAKAPSATISTKIPAAPDDLWRNESAYWTWLAEHCKASRLRLGIADHDLLQFHQCDLPFLTAPHIGRLLKRLLDEGYCRRIGISVYFRQEALAALSLPAVSSLQIPANLLDTRFLEPSFLSAVRATRASLIVRSALLQAVLVDSAPLPPVKRQEELLELRRKARDVAGGASLQELALQFLFKNHAADLSIILVGVGSPTSLQENIDMISRLRGPVSQDLLSRFEEIRSWTLERDLLNPSAWNK